MRRVVKREFVPDMMTQLIRSYPLDACIYCTHYVLGYCLAHEAEIPDGFQLEGSDCKHFKDELE